jgi:hypothetical protein
MFSHGEWKYVPSRNLTLPPGQPQTPPYFEVSNMPVQTSHLGPPKITVVCWLHTRQHNSLVAIFVNIFLPKQPSPYSRIFKPIVWELLSVSLCTATHQNQSFSLYLSSRIFHLTSFWGEGGGFKFSLNQNENYA